MDLKTGDLVVYKCPEYGMYGIGKLTITEDHKDPKTGEFIEGDLKVSTGGSISPVDLKDCHKISVEVHNYISALEDIRKSLGELAEEKLGMRYNEI